MQPLGDQSIDVNGDWMVDLFLPDLTQFVIK
jgi:hypothetical protein